MDFHLGSGRKQEAKQIPGKQMPPDKTNTSNNNKKQKAEDTSELSFQFLVILIPVIFFFPGIYFGLFHEIVLYNYGVVCKVNHIG